MAGMHATTEITRRIEDVYAFFLDLDRTVAPTDHMVRSVVKTPEGPVGAGTTFRMRQRSLGKVRDQTVHVIAVEPNRGDSRPVGPLKLFPWLADLIGERNWRRRIRLAKGVLEGRSPA